jgi:hypothetical protein
VADLARDFNDRLELFFGESSDAQARVYARLRGGEPFDGLTLRGNLTGPSCVYAETLPARVALADQGPGASLLAAAVVPEPCFWTPAMPQLYLAAVELRRGDVVLARAERPFGLRTLGAAGRNLIYDGKRWVLRGLYRDAAGPTGLNEWHKADTAMVVASPDDRLCREASRVGVLIVAELDTAEPGEIRRLSRHPAVGMVSLPADAAVDLGGWGHNMLLAARVVKDESSSAPEWADIAIVDAKNNIDEAIRIAKLPVIAVRRDVEPLTTIAGGRTHCDRLQRDLAGRGADFAGYIV